MKKRFLAFLLCLSILLMACACAAETEPPIASYPEHQESSPQLTLSEVNVESSKTEAPTPSADPSGEIPPIETSDESLTVEESDVVIEPIQPIVPEEKETTLEKVLSFDIGIDGLMEYNFLFYDDPSTADIIVYGDAYTDGNGVFYQAADSEIIRVNDGAKFPFISWSQVFDIEVRQNDFYILKAGETGSYGILYHYDISTGFETPTLIAQYDNLPSGSLGFAGGVPVILEQGNVYSVEGRRLSKSKAPFAIEESKDSSVSVQKQNDVLTIQQGENFYCYVPALSDTGTFVAETKDWDGNWIYSYYDQNGSIKTKFLYTTQYPGSTISCEIDFTWGKEIYTVDLYTPYCATLGGKFFEGLVDGKVFFDVYGNAYYAAYYLDHCDIYKIDQGYSDIQFPVDEKLQAGDSSVAPTSNASGSSASSVQYLDISRAEVKANALEMIITT